MCAVQSTWQFQEIARVFPVITASRLMINQLADLFHCEIVAHSDGAKDAVHTELFEE